MATTKIVITDNTVWPAFNLRMPDELKMRLKACAEKEHRSLNSEIIHRLYKSLDGWTR